MAELRLELALSFDLELPGWAPLTWSPDGSHFLVSNADDRARIGVVDVADLTAVRDVGTSTVGPVWDAVWLPS